MSLVLLAIADPQLRQVCRQQLRAAGHAALALDRPLALLDLSQRLRWDALCIDDSELGRSALAVANQPPRHPVVGLGIAAEGTSTVLELPVGGTELLAALDRLRPAASAPLSLHLDPVSRRVLVNDREVRLSDIEFRFFRLLYERRPEEVSFEEAASAVWGGAVTEASSSLRVHVSNLRVKLAAAGLTDAVQSRRGRGYALVI